MKTKPTRVTWLPAHPSAGSVSMLRHWRELDGVFRATPDASLEIACPLGLPPELPPPGGRIARAWKKYAEYPLRVGLAGGAEVIHVLDHSFAHLLRFAARGSRKIVTVHDLAPLEDETLSPSQRDRFRRTLACLNDADLLLPVSEFTARALRTFLSGKPRISVLPMGVNVAAFTERRALPASLELPALPRLLSVGSALPRKNLALLPAILEAVIRDAGPVSLVRVGAALPIGLRRKIEAILGPGRLVEAGNIPDDELIPIYQACDVLIFPSTLEGFGLPVAEAMAAGCPVVTSDAASLPEVAGNAALYFHPMDPVAAAGHIVRILRDPALRSDLIARGTRRAAELAWENHAATLRELYRECSGKAVEGGAPATPR